MKKRADRSRPVLMRQRLVDRVLTARGVAMVEAPIGFGKSVLLSSLVEAEADVLLVNADDPSEVETAVVLRHLDDASAESLVIAVDNASRSGDLIANVKDHPSLRSLVVADRVIGPNLHHVLADYELLAIGPDDLRFNEREVAACFRLLADPSDASDAGAGDGQLDGTGVNEDSEIVKGVAYLVTPASEGWPVSVVHMLEAVVAAQDRLERATELGQPGLDANMFADDYLAAIDPSITDAITALAHFDRFTHPCVKALAGPGGLERLAAGGAAILPAGRGWLRMPKPASAPLRLQFALPSEAALLLTPVLVASGGIIPGLRASIQARCFSAASATLRELSGITLDDLDQQALIDVVETLRADHDTPQLALIQARAHGNLADLPASEACVEACLAMDDGSSTSDADFSTAMVEARIEQVYSKAFTPGYDTQKAVDEVRGSLNGNLLPAHSLRLDEIEALALGQHSDPQQVQLAADELKQIAVRWQTLGETGRSVAILRRLSAAVHTHLGTYPEAIRALGQAHELAWERVVDRAMTLTLMCRMRVLAGDIDGIEGTLKEAESLAKLKNMRWLTAYLRWSEMWLAARRLQPDGVLDSLAATATLLGPLLDHETGEGFRSEAAIALAEVGLVVEASEQLEAIRAAGGGESLEYAIADIVVAARSGKVEATDRAVDTLESSGRLPSSRRWRVLLEQSIAHEVTGAAEASIELRTQALDQAAEVELSLIAERLLKNAPAPGAVGRRPSLTLSIQVLGRFEVRDGSQLVVLPDGHVGVVVKMLALADGPLAVDVIIDALWPEAEPAVGRRRIKNVVARLRGLVGADRIVRSNDTLALSAETEVDLRTFDAMIRASLAHDIPEVNRAKKLVAALELYNGSVLPADLYDEWSFEHRRSAEARALAAVDRVFALAPGHRPSAAWLLEVVLRVTPDDDQRLVRVARQALAENHLACAQAALGRALAAAQDLGVTIDDEIGDLRYLLKSV